MRNYCQDTRVVTERFPLTALVSPVKERRQRERLKIETVSDDAAKSDGNSKHFMKMSLAKTIRMRASPRICPECCRAELIAVLYDYQMWWIERSTPLEREKKHWEERRHYGSNVANIVFLYYQSNCFSLCCSTVKNCFYLRRECSNHGPVGATVNENEMSYHYVSKVSLRHHDDDTCVTFKHRVS